MNYWQTIWVGAFRPLFVFTFWVCAVILCAAAVFVCTRICMWVERKTRLPEKGEVTDQQ